MKKQYFYLLIISLITLSPLSVFADGGMIIWPPDVHLDQTAQNAIVAWNGQKEIIILSNDIQSSESATALRIVPLPSNPSDIKEGSFESFEKLVEIINLKIEDIRNQWIFGGKDEENAPTAGIEITFQEKIGAHDVTVVKVNNLDYFLEWIESFATNKGLKVKAISSEFKEGIKNYLKRNIRYFVFDVIDTAEGEESINPLIYSFNSDSLYYPILISGVSEIEESRAEIRVFLITKDSPRERTVNPYWRGYYGYPVELSKEELEEISEEFAELFGSEATVTIFDYHGLLKEINKDLVFYPENIWTRNFQMGDIGEDVETLQEILINEGFWDSELEASTLFGETTRRNLIAFQDYHILEETGYFDTKTQEYIGEGFTLSLKEETPSDFQFKENLSLGVQHNDVIQLKTILDAEVDHEAWQGTEYFGAKTLAAVKAFQEKYRNEISEFAGYQIGCTGFVGKGTRAMLNKILGW